MRKGESLIKVGMEVVNEKELFKSDCWKIHKEKVT